MKLFPTLAPLALALILCPAYADGLKSMPAPPQVTSLGERQGELIGRELTSANVFARANMTAVEFSYERGLTIALIEMTPEVLQAAIGLITPDAGELSVSLFSELGSGKVVGLSLTQTNVPDANPLSALSPDEVQRILKAFEQVAGGGSGDGGKLVAASVDWRASDAKESASATLLQATPSTQGTFAAYAQIFRTAMSFAQGYEIRTQANGDFEARRPATDPRGVNHLEVRSDAKGGGVVNMGYSTPIARGLESHLRKVLLKVDEAEAAGSLRQPKGATIVPVTPGQDTSDALTELLEAAGK